MKSLYYAPQEDILCSSRTYSSYKLLNWKVIGSKDGKKWEDIDEQHLNSQRQEIETDKSYKYIRFI